MFCKQGNPWVPLIDSDLPPSRLGSGRRRSSQVTILTTILIAVLTAVAIEGPMVHIVDNGEPQASGATVRTSGGILYATHSPISIIGNGGFTNASGVVWGSGTISDPYVIADWEISPSVLDGILIQDTDVHFVVRTCYVHDGASGGISLTNCVNGTLTDNRCLNGNTGIVLDSSSSNTLVNNDCSANYGDGIYLWSSSNNNALVNNNCGSNSYDGIGLQSSSSNRLDGNNCSSNTVAGIELFSSSGNNTLTKNDCSNNGGTGIILVESNNNTLIDNYISNEGAGIYLGASSNNTLSGNNCSDDYVGIDLEGPCNDNEISRNLVCDNTGYGVEVLSGSNNRIWNNTIIGNNGATGAYDASHVQAFDGGTHNWWNSTNGYGNWWSDWQSPDIAPPYGIVDLPYVISGRLDVRERDWSRDYYPLTTTPQESHTSMMLLVVIAFVVAIVVVIAFVVAIVLISEARRRKAQ
jgi:parallel beta-helix repeat protein